MPLHNGDMNLDDNPLSPTHQHNRRAWDARVRQKKTFARAIEDEEFRTALGDVDLRGRKLLCLAAGGGRQSVIYAASGAEVTVVDISPAMLEIDRVAAAERGYHVRTVEASMDHLPMLKEGEFDIVIHPVSTCYVPDIRPVYREVARVTRIGGCYVSQHKQPASLQADVVPSPRGYELIEPYYRSGPLHAVSGSRHREEGTLEFLHRWEELIGQMCRAGFVIEDLTEPPHADERDSAGSFGHRSSYVAPYVRIRARRVGPPKRDAGASLWTP
jgi:ubiquinone/menaquinone biosynthesis C-methylase UbiE